MTIGNYLQQAASKLIKCGISSPQLDSELLTCEVLGLSRAELLASNNQELATNQSQAINQLLTRRCNHEPIAYIIGRKEFYGLEFKVTNQVMVPRPESEAIVEFVQASAPDNGRILDVGTGSGALACSIKHERPDLHVAACDVSLDALQVAKTNMQRLTLDIDVFQSDLLNQVQPKYDWLVANLPYVANKDNLNQSAMFEPEVALLSEDGGLHHYRQLFKQLGEPQWQSVTKVVIEADPWQLAPLEQELSGWKGRQLSDYTLVLSRTPN